MKYNNRSFIYRMIRKYALAIFFGNLAGITYIILAHIASVPNFIPLLTASILFGAGIAAQMAVYRKQLGGWYNYFSGMGHGIRSGLYALFFLGIYLIANDIFLTDPTLSHLADYGLHAWVGRMFLFLSALILIPIYSFILMQFFKGKPRNEVEEELPSNYRNVFRENYA